MDSDDEELEAKKKVNGVAIKDKIEKFKKFLKENNYWNKLTVNNNNLTVGGYLDLSETQIKELPDNLMAREVYKDKEYITLNNIKEGYNKERKYIYFDGILWGNVKSVKRKDNITIYKNPLGYCVIEKELSAHGKTLKEAIEDLTFKKLKNTDISEIIKEIKKTGKVTRLQYRAITGACRMGTEGFCNRHNIQELEEIELERSKEILIPGKDYGAKRFWDLIDNRGENNE